MAVLEQNLEAHVRGDTYAFPVEFLSAGVPQDMTGWVVWFTVKHHPLQPDTEAVIQKQVSVTGTTVIIPVPSTDTAELPPLNYYFDIQLVSPAGDAVQTLIKGRWQLTEDVTITTVTAPEVVTP